MMKGHESRGGEMLKTKGFRRGEEGCKKIKATIKTREDKRGYVIFG
jgi:hypothetical protein